jgi:hypothetical protein|tara:strand:+ start:4566 stop:4826 length:261 start_codon:yes stop_codon:yes gene_type:complete
MKNTLMIDLDSDREDPIRITKPENVVETVKDEDSARKMVMDDLTTVCNALGTLITIAEDNNYFDSEKAVKMCIDYLNDNFIKEDKI